MTLKIRRFWFENFLYLALSQKHFLSILRRLEESFMEAFFDFLYFVIILVNLDLFEKIKKCLHETFLKIVLKCEECFL